MNYEYHYNKLIESRQILNRKKHSGIYYEKHHIIPKSIGGTNNNSNLILLTPKEHYIAHLLLANMYTGINKQKMVYALWRLSNDKQNNHVTSRQYNNLKNIFSEEISKKKRGKKLSDVTRIKMSISAKNKPPMTDETRKKLSIAKRNISIETRQKISKAHIGKKLSDITKNKISNTKKETLKDKKNHPMYNKKHSDET